VATPYLHSGKTLPSQWQHHTFTVAKPYLHSGNTIPSQWQHPTFTVATPYLHSGNTLPSTPVGHSVNNKESYEDTKILMEAINYDKFKWQICGDLKVIALLLGLQQRFTKYCCFICEWDRRFRSLH